MLAEVMSVLLVLIFVILLHYYTKRFLTQDYHHQTHHGTSSPSIFLVPTGFLHNPITLSTINITNHNDQHSPSIKGLESSAISLIPQFVYEAKGEMGLECVVCLSSFKNEEKGRKLQVCQHAFHVECIDMWLHSHTTCPVCRAPALKVLSLAHIGNVVADSPLSENIETDMNLQNSGELVEIAVEVPNMGTESDDAR